MANYKEIGNDVNLEVGGESYPITEASYTEDADVAETQFNTGLNPSMVVTGVTYSGSFAHAGANQDLQAALYDATVPDETADDANNRQTSAPIQVSILTITDSETEYKFENVIIDSRDKDFPADDRTEVSYDFMAEKLTRNQDTSTNKTGLNRLDTESTPGPGFSGDGE